MIKQTSHVLPLFAREGAKARLRLLARMRRQIEDWDVKDFTFLSVLAQLEELEAGYKAILQGDKKCSKGSK